jgi:glycosyltransferase involved in cell wall biosynthesis
VTEEDKYWYYKNCTAFTFPSLAEGFGLPVVEAMYFGKPLFLSSHTCLPEIGGDLAYYFDRDFDPEDMRAVFENGMNRYNQELGIRLRQRACDFSWEKCAASYLKIYREL